MNITIPVSDLPAARKLLTRIRFERLNLPVLTHVLATIDAAGLTLAVTDLDHWLETRIPATIDPFTPGRFLIPADALKAAARGDKGSAAHFAYTEHRGRHHAHAHRHCGGMTVKSVYHPERRGGLPGTPHRRGTDHGPAQGNLRRPRHRRRLRLHRRHPLRPQRRAVHPGGWRHADRHRRTPIGRRTRPCSRPGVHPAHRRRACARPSGLRHPRRRSPASRTRTDDAHIQFRSGPHTLIAKTIEGHYPDYRHVIPSYLPESVTIPETHRAALIAWLRSLKGKSNSVRLTWETPGHLTLTHRDYDTVGATIQVPVTTEGQPPEIAFDPKYLADALEIGPTLRLVDKLNPGMATSPSGNFCVLMNQRFTEETAKVETASETPAPAMAA